MLPDRTLILEPEMQRHLTAYMRQMFAPEDDILQTVRRNTIKHGMPQIEIRPEEGQILQFLAQLIGARRILEMGTLAGYSGIWLARALPEGGKLITLEVSSKHAAVSREHFAMAGVADRVEIMEGSAMDSLHKLSDAEPFDMVFIDADKPSYPAYLYWSVTHVRPGGLITAHNAFREGKLFEDDEAANATRFFLESLAEHPRLISTVIPIGDGIAVAMIK